MTEPTRENTNEANVNFPPEESSSTNDDGNATQNENDHATTSHHQLSSLEWERGVKLLLELEGDHQHPTTMKTPQRCSTRSLRNALDRNYASHSRSEAFQMLNTLGELSEVYASACTTPVGFRKEARDDEGNRSDEGEERSPASPSLPGDQSQVVLQSRMTHLRRNIFALDRNANFSFLGPRRHQQ